MLPRRARFEGVDSDGVDRPLVERQMLRRAFLLTAIAVGLSAAGALAFAPSFSRVTQAWSSGIAWTGRAFTPVPMPRDSSAASPDPSLDNSGAPGTFCPTLPHDPALGVASTHADQGMSTGTSLSASASTPLAGKVDLLAVPAMCDVVSDTTHASPARPPILP